MGIGVTEGVKEIGAGEISVPLLEVLFDWSVTGTPLGAILACPASVEGFSLETAGRIICGY